MVKLITSLYVITIGWTGVMIIQEWIRPYILICTIILLYVISKIIKKNKIYYKVFGIRDSLLICFIVYVIALSFFLPNPKTFNYILAYGFVFTIAYSVTKYFFAINTNNHLIQKYNYIGVLVVLVYGIFEVIMNNYLNSDLISIIWQNRTNGAIAKIGSHSFIRSYGMMPEPGIFGLYLNSLGILAMYYSSQNHNMTRKTIFYLLFFTNYYFISSAASLFSIVLAIIIVQILLSKNSKSILKNIFYLLGFSVIMFFVISNTNLTIIDKIIKPNVYSIERYDRWVLAVDLISNMSGFGKGLGYISSTYGSSLNNWYFMLLVETGIVGFLMIMIFLFLSIKKGISNQEMKPYLLGIFSNIIHFGAISTFFNPFLFIIIAIMDIELIRTNNTHRKKLQLSQN